MNVGRSPSLRFLLLSLSLGALGCDSSPRLDGPTAMAQVSERDLLRDHARLVLEAQCGDCHIGEYPSALPAALEVYNLSALEWSATMSIEQLEDAYGRLDTPLPEDGPQVTARDLKRFRRFIDLERQRRVAPAPETGAPCI